MAVEPDTTTPLAYQLREWRDKLSREGQLDPVVWVRDRVGYVEIDDGHYPPGKRVLRIPANTPFDKAIALILLWM